MTGKNRQNENIGTTWPELQESKERTFGDAGRGSRTVFLLQGLDRS